MSLEYKQNPFHVKVISRWISKQLNDFPDCKKSDIIYDYTNGVKILQLAIILTNANKSIQIKYNPKNNVEKTKNCNIALELFKNDGVQLQSITSKDIINNNEKVINDLIWAIIIHYSISNKNNLLKWAFKKTKPYANINRFSPYWLSMCALLDTYVPNKINYSTLNKNDSKFNAELAMKVMKELEIPIYIKPEDFLHNKIDKKSLLIQLAAAKNVLKKLKYDQIKFKKDNKFVKDFPHISLVQSEVFAISTNDYKEPVINPIKKYQDKIFELSLELDKVKADYETQKEDIIKLNREADLFANTLNDKLKELTELSKTLKTEEKHSKKYVAEIDDIDEDEELLAKQLIDTQEENEVLNREVDLFANTLSEKLEEYTTVNREADIFAVALEESLEKNEELDREADIFANKLSETLIENKSMKEKISALNREADLFANCLAEKIDENEAINRECDMFVDSLAKEVQKNIILNREADLFAYNLSDKIEEIKKLNKKINDISKDLNNEKMENKTLNEESVFIANKLNEKILENSQLKSSKKFP